MDYPGVGTGVWVRKKGKILFGLRKGMYLPGTWCIPGGKLEMYEEWGEGARREAREETGVEIADLRFVAVLDDPNPAVGTHYLSLHFVADWVSGEAMVTEPEKFAQWKWFSLDELPEPIFPSTGNFIKNGYNPFTI